MTPAIICIDDQRPVLAAVLADLAPLETGFSLTGCESAQEALEEIERLDRAGTFVALVISDQVMPGESGVDLLARLQVDPRFRHCRKILLTGQASQADTIAAINRARVDRYIDKPWQSADLLTIARALATRAVLAAGLDEMPHGLLDGDELLRAGQGGGDS